MNRPGQFSSRDFEVSVVVTVVASAVTWLEEAAFEEAKSAFEAYKPQGAWVDARGNKLVAQIESDIRPTDLSDRKEGWKATFRVGRLVPEGTRRNRP